MTSSQATSPGSTVLNSWYQVQLALRPSRFSRDL